jgi:hypothetical protein
MAHSTDIIGYQFNGAHYCPRCIIEALPTGPGGAFDGWKLAPEYALRTPVETNLSEIAYAFQIDRSDESTFDSAEFPKVIFDSQAEGPEMCAICGVDITDSDSAPTNPRVSDVWHYGNERSVTVLRYSDLKAKLEAEARNGATRETLPARLANVAAALQELERTGSSNSWSWHTLTLEGF